MVHIMNQPKLRHDDGPIVSLQFYILIALVITFRISLTIECLFSFLSVLLSFQHANSANKCAKLQTCLVAVWACALCQSSVAPLAVANCKSFAEVNTRYKIHNFCKHIAVALPCRCGDSCGDTGSPAGLLKQWRYELASNDHVGSRRSRPNAGYGLRAGYSQDCFTNTS